MASGLNLEALQLLSPEQLATIPIMPAPPGQTTNFKDHPSLTPSVLIITGITVPLIFIFLGLRIYIRARINRDFTIDDPTIDSVHWLDSFNAGYPWKWARWTTYLGCSPDTDNAQLSQGKSILARQSPESRLHGTNIWYAHQASLATAMLFAIASITVKTSILIFILRLFSRFRAARIMSWIGIVAVIIFYVSYVIPSLVLCVPNMSTTASCSKFEAAMSNAHGIFSTVSDLYILFIPVYMIGNLQLSPRSKYSLAGVFLTGLGACIASLIGSIYRFKFASSDDLTWASVPVYATVILELNLGIICAYDSLESLDNDQHACQMNDLRQYDVTITAG
ncbi:hypothetical protein F5Y02DRAFT_418100 [Annulohypoxylon stygium]|nr:hypothetical protein F5Y02DRAFT_418100 [Annulohypoxylon stygium]